MSVDGVLDKVRAWLGWARLNAYAGLAHDRGSEHGHHGAGAGHGHTHGVIDPTIATTDRGIWAIKWSFVILAITAALQILVVLATGSVALLADTIHNVADAMTAIPLWIAFQLARREPTATFTYGLGRVEDLAGIAIVLIILLSALVAGYESISRIFNPLPITMLGWVALAGFVGFVGNEIVAEFRIRVGREINSAALVADGYHARTDGLTSLAVVAGAFGVWLGFPLADPIIGLLITVAILGIVWQSAQAVLIRMLDGVDPAIVGEVHHAAAHVPGVERVLDVKARWLGHKLHVDVSILVDRALPVAKADGLVAALQRELFVHIPALSVANVRCTGDAPASTNTVPARHAGHHHALELFAFARPLAAGRLEIADTERGERMRLTLATAVDALSASVTIKRTAGNIETLPLVRNAGTPDIYESTVAPAEPHEFSAELHLSVGDQNDVLPFTMIKPAGHTH